jgi:hypothetical protein
MEEEETSFSRSAIRRLVDDFVVSYFNGSVKPTLAERNPTTKSDAEYLMDGPQFEKIRKSEIWSYANAIGTGYQYRVTYRDRRFSDLDRLLGMYSGGINLSEEDRSKVENRLYETILLLVREGRLPQSFKVQSARDVQLERLVASVEQLNRSLEILDEKVRALENRLASPSPPQRQNPSTPTEQ